MPARRPLLQMVRQALTEERQLQHKLDKMAKDEWLQKTPLERNISPVCEAWRGEW